MRVCDHPVTGPMFKIEARAVSARRTSAPPQKKGAIQGHAPGRHWPTLALQRQPDPKVDYFPHKTQAIRLNGLLNATPVDAPAIIKDLETLDRDPARVAKVEEAYKARFKTELDADLAAHLTGDDLAHARFLLYGPAPKGDFAEVTETKPGDEKHRGKAAGGEVTLNTGLEYTRPGGEKFSEAFAVGYEGSQSKEARFIQFLWTEVIATLPGKAPAAVADTARSLSGSIETTTNPAMPKRIVDTIGTSPYYESAGADVRTATGTKIYDQPAHSFEVVNRQFEAGATQVVERDHFDDYLIVGYKAVYRVSHIVEWTFTSKAKPPRKPIFDSAGPVTGLPKEVKEVLVKRFPKLEYVQ